MNFAFSRKYDLVICNGLLHYVDKKLDLLAKIKAATVARGLNMISLFSGVTPLPDCHKITSVFCDDENGITLSSYSDWWVEFLSFDRNKPEISHPGFEPHRHSFIKLIARKRA